MLVQASARDDDRFGVIVLLQPTIILDKGEDNLLSTGDKQIVEIDQPPIFDSKLATLDLLIVDIAIYTNRKLILVGDVVRLLNVKEIL